MAFPFITEENFETGTLGHFDVETDTESRLDFPHYSTLARTPGLEMPWRGAYCMRVNLANDGSPANAYVQETGSWDLAASGVLVVRFMFWLSPDTVMANNDEFAIMQLWSSTSTAEAGFHINFTTADGFRLGVSETGSGGFLKPLTLGVWHTVEATFTIDSGANDGSIAALLDGSAFSTITSLTQGAITSGVLGVVSQDSGTTRGTILFDQIVTDDARIYPLSDRFPTTVRLTKSSHVFVGPGTVAHIELISGAATDNVLQVFDTDAGSVLDASNAILTLTNTANSQTVLHAEPVFFKRGCFVQLAGTNPSATVTIKRAAHYSPGAMRACGLQRKPPPVGA